MHTDADDTLARTLRTLPRLALDGVPGCDAASLTVVHDGEARTLTATEARVRRLDSVQYREGDGPCLTAIRQARVVTVSDYRAEPRWPELASQSLDLGIHSSLSVPLARDGTALAGLNLYAEAPGAFTDDSRRAADALARQAMVLLDSIQQLHNERAAHARERELATDLQNSLLPTLPSLPGIRCAARYLVSNGDAQVGGDWYDVFPLPDGAVGVAIGDAMGHDVAAAAAMGQLRSVLRSYAYEGSSPSVVLDRLDRLVQGFEMAQVATVVYGRLTLERGHGTLLFSNAGHPPPLVRRPDGTVHRVQRGASPLIGVLAAGAMPRMEATADLPAGSLLLLYTDGLVETRTRDIDAGIDALGSALAGIDRVDDPERVCDELLARLRGSAERRTGQEDDIALLAILVTADDGDRADELPGMAASDASG